MPTIPMNYLPHYTKKKQILARKELKLRRLLQRGAPAPQVSAAALAVRESRISMLLAQRATIPPRESPDIARLATIDEAIRALQILPVDEILAQFMSPTA